MIRVLTGDALAVLPTLEAGRAQLCVTSPPFYNLRDYGHADQIGLEKTPEEYVERLVGIFAEVRRVLHPTGMLAVNMGDSYSRQGGDNSKRDPAALMGGQAKTVGAGSYAGGNGRVPDGLRPGDLLGMPWRVAFALQRDGWILRSAMCLIKASPMPESVGGCRWERCETKTATDDSIDCPGCAKCAPNGGLVLRWGSGRPTSAYEMLFLFAKSARYFWDAEAVRVESTPDMQRRAANGHTRGANGKLDGSRQDHDTLRGEGAKEIAAAGRNAWNYQHFEEARDVWEWRPAPFSEAHFATFPPALPVWCIKAATPEAGCCPKCGMPWARVTERERTPRQGAHFVFGARDNGRQNHHGQAGSAYTEVTASQTIGWRPTCTCAAPARPALVLDPFAGAGTTGLAADRLGRDAVLIELSEAYAAMARGRLTRDAGLFADIDCEAKREATG